MPILCTDLIVSMELLNFIFRLGVVFAIFGFIWGIINIAIRLLTPGRSRQLAEVYILKAVQYLLLVNVTFLICYNQEITKLDAKSQLVYGGIILVMYFVGKLQNKQNKQVMFQMYTNGMMQNNLGFNLKAEVAVIVLSILAFVGLHFNPNLAFNPLALWFQDSILNIEDTPIFGFIFKVIGFFFLVNILLKMVNSVLMILSGKAFQRSNDPYNNDQHRKQKDDDKFDDYEEIQ